MNTKSLTAKMLSRFKESLHSWISLWRFLANLHDLNFYQGLEDPQTRDLGFRQTKRPPTLLSTGEDHPTSNRCASREGGGPPKRYLCCRGGTP